MNRIFAADIGATNSRFAAFATTDDSQELGRSVWLKTQDARSFQDMLDQALSQGLPEFDSFDMAVLAVAGAVEGGQYSKLSNASWAVDLRGGVKYGFKKCLLINDFVAQAYACRSLAAESARVLQPGTINPASPLITVGAGSGLGHCALMPDSGGGFIPIPSEGGHAALALNGPEECSLGEFVRDRLASPYVFNEQVVSGSGLALLHEYLTGDRLTPAEVSARLTPESETARWFARFYARICRNYALTMLSSGGVYLTGGVAAKNPILVEHPEFLNEFRSSPAHSGLLASMPVFLNTNEEMGLQGAALCGRLALRKNAAP